MSRWHFCPLDRECRETTFLFSVRGRRDEDSEAPLALAIAQAMAAPWRLHYRGRCHFYMLALRFGDRWYAPEKGRSVWFERRPLRATTDVDGDASGETGELEPIRLEGPGRGSRV